MTALWEAELAGFGEYEDFIIAEEMEEDREYWEWKPAPLRWQPPVRLLRRAEMDKRKAAVRKRKTRLEYERNDEGEVAFFVYVPDEDVVGIEANTPQRCGKWCVCRDRGKNYSRAAFKRNTRWEMEH